MDLHGWSIIRLSVDWETGVLSIDVGLGNGEVAVVGAPPTVGRVGLPRSSEPAISRVDVGHEKLNIEVQGGGHISIDASSIEMHDRR